MTDASDHNVSFFAGPDLPAAAYAGVRSRRMLAFALDFALVSLMAGTLTVVFAIATLGLSLLVVPATWPLVAFFYNGLFFTGRRMATPGMRLADLQARAIDGTPPSFVAAAVHGALLYASWTFPPIFLVSLITPDKRCLHDVLAGLIVVRRPD